MSYKPTSQQIEDAKNVYDNIIFTQTLNPNEVKRAFKLLYGYDAYTAQQAKQVVSAYFLYQYQKTDVTETTAPLETVQESHSEDFTHAPILDNDTEELRFLNNIDKSDGFIDVYARIDDVKTRIDKRSKEYKQSQNKE
jgi:hypothetical protein